MGGGLKSIVTEPLEPHITPEKFWELWEAECRAGAKTEIPSIGAWTGAGVTRHEEKEIDGGFEVEDECSGGMFGPSEIPVIRTKHTFDKAKGEWNMATYLGSWESKDLELTTRVRVQPDSGFSLEVYSEIEPGRRQSSQDQLKVLEFLLKAMLTKAKAANTAPALTADADSPEGDGKVVLSEDLGDVDPDALWDHLTAVIKEGGFKKDITDHKVEDLPDGGFLVSDTFGEYRTFEVYDFDKAKNILTSSTFENDEKRDPQANNECYRMRILKNPTRMELWRESVPGRKCMKQVAEMLQRSIDGVLAAAEQ